MLTKLQIAFCVLAGLGIVVFGVGMISNVNVAKVPGWLALVAWGSFGLVVASCIGVVVTLVLDREKEPGSDEDEADLSTTDEPLPDDDSIPELTNDDLQSEVDTMGSPVDFPEPGSEETVEFSTLPSDE